MGYVLSSTEFASLHDVYKGVDEEEDCHKTEQFLWRDLSSDFDVIGLLYISMYN